MFFYEPQMNIVFLFFLEDVNALQKRSMVYTIVIELMQIHVSDRKEHKRTL